MSYETYQQFARDSDRVRREQERQRRPSPPTAQDREAEVLRNAGIELRAADIQRQIYEDAHRKVQARLAQDPEYQAGRERLRRQQEETTCEFRALILGEIFSTVIAGRGVPVRNLASEGLVLSWVNLDERPSRQWFVSLMHSRPDLANQLEWQSPDVLDPRKQAEARKQRLEQDRKTFDTVCRKHLIGSTEANFRLLRDVLGDDLTEYSATQAITSGAAQLSPASVTEIQQWKQEAAQAQQDYFRNQATPDELRHSVRAESVQVRKTAAQQQFEFELARGYERDVVIGKCLALPSHWNGQLLDASFIKRADPATLRLMVRKFGTSQISARLHGVRSVTSEKGVEYVFE
jgi:hypothetical protein